MNIATMKRVLTILEQAGVADSRSFDAEHDVIYLPLMIKDTPFADQLKEAGCHWDSEAGGWAAF